MKNTLRNSNFGFTKWCLSLIAAGWMGVAQAGVLLDQNFASFNNGDLVGQQGWTQSGAASPNLTIANSVLVFANTGQDAGVAFTSANSGSLYIGFKMRVTSSQTGDYFASFNTTAGGTAYSGRLSIKKGATTSKFVLGLLMGNTGATTSYGTSELDTNTDYVVIFKYNFVSGALNDTGLIYVNPSNSSTENANTPYLNTVTWAGTSAENAAQAAVSIRQGSNTAAAAGTISRMIVSNDWASVAAIAVSSSPSVTPSVSTLTGFTTTAGTASAAQTFTVTGVNLSADVTVTAPTGFEVATDGAAFGGSKTLTKDAAGTVSGTISVRIAASTAQGTLALANVTLVSGATSGNVAVSGTVSQAGVAPTVTAATIPGTFGVALSANVVASQNPTSYAISSGTLPAGLSLNPTTGAITGTPTAAGTGVVVAVTASNATGTSAPANLTFDIAKASQTITGLSTADSKYTTTAPYPLSAVASSGLAPIYTSSNGAVATISGSTVTIVGAGTTTITASQAGDNNYNAAPNLTQTLTITLPPMMAWEMTGQSNGGSSPMAPTTVDNRLVVEGLTKGIGIGAVTTGNVWGGNDFMGTDLASAIANQDFATFSVTPASGYQVSFSQIPAYNIRRSSTGPLTGIWQYRKGSGAYTDIGSSISWGTVTSGNYNPQPAINLSAITDLQNVPAGTTVTFRVVTWGGTGTAGTWYINTIAGDDLAVLGTISEYTAVVPSLSSFTPAFGATGSTVTISGSNLAGVTGVKFNGQSATFAIQSSSQITATVPAGLQAGKISLIYGSPAAEVLSTTNFEPLDGSGLATVVNGDATSPYVNTAIFAKGQSNNQTLAVTVSNPIVDSTVSKVRITLPSDFSQPNSANCLLNGAGTVSVSGRALTIDGAVITSNSPLTVTVSGLSTPETSASTALDGNYGITVETAGAGGTLANVLVAPTAYVLVPIINLRGVDANGVPTQIGKKVAFEGVVTATGLGSAAGKTKAYVQDASAAVYVYSAAFTSAPIQGNVYAALGTLTQFRGVTQIDPGKASNLIDRGAGVLPEPTVLTLPISSTVGERYEGSLVKVVGLSRAPAEVDAWATSATITLQDSAASTVDLFLQPGSTATTEPATYPATVVGILGQYAPVSPFTAGYQLQPRTQADLIVNTAPADNIPPVITLIGDNPQLVANGAVYADLGASVTDNVDATRTITGAGTVNTTIAGDYTVTYNATDAAGNNAVAVVRTVRVAAPLGSTYNSWLGTATPSDAAFWDYVYGATAPGQLPASLRPTTVITGGNLVLTYYVRQNTIGLNVTAKMSSDLAAGAAGWSTAGVTDVAVGAPTTVNGVSVQQRTASVAVSGAKKFLKLEGVQAQ